MESVHISLSAEEVFRIGHHFIVTNSLMTTWIVMSILIAFSLLTTKKLSVIPGRLQSVVEMIIEGLKGLFESVLHEKVDIYFPLLATIFLFIICLNWIGLLPGVGTLGIEKIEEGHKAFIPIFRAGTADLNTTLALSVIVVSVIQYAGINSLGIKYFKKFINVSNPINFYVGILELISEISKIISFAFRLFGNIFAGEVLLTVIAFLMPVVAPLPFIGLELFVGFIQALVFSMLTTVFISVAATKTEH
jgi:F-type H+-transporting ATPase subunit a